MAVPLFNLAPNLTDSESDSLALPLILKYKFILRAGTITFGKQNTFPESFGLLDQAFLSGINFFDSTEMYPVVQRAQTQGQGRSEERRFGHQGCEVALRVSVHADHGVPAWFSLLMCENLL
ncbi:unnamed protein product [Prunus armeniaca]